MNRSSTLNQSVNQFAINLKYCKVNKIISKYGYEYLVKEQLIDFKGSLHYNKDYNYKEFATFENSKARLSTNIKLELGFLVFKDEVIFAVKEQIYYNDTMGVFHYLLTSINDYYSCMILDDFIQDFQSLNSNISFLLLDSNYHIPIIPNKLMPKENNKKFISFQINETKAHSNIYFEKDKLRQAKSDNITFYAINLNTLELQQFILFLTNNKKFGYAGLPAFKSYNDDFEEDVAIKSNIQQLDIILNYNLSATEAEQTKKLIEKVEISINQILKE